jgi:hypothetical protein
MPKVRAGLTLARGEALDKSERREVTRAGTSCRRDFVRRQLMRAQWRNFAFSSF